MKNAKNVGTVDLWANIGGYAGMIVGISILQLIDMLFGLVRRCKSDERTTQMRESRSSIGVTGKIIKTFLYLKKKQSQNDKENMNLP